jgi:cytochrome c553
MAGPCFVLVLALTAAQEAASLAEAYARDVRPVLRTLCSKCHSPQKKKGDVDLVSPGDGRDALRDRKLWRKSAAQLEILEMPPSDAPQPNAEQRGMLLKWMKAAADFVDCSDPAELDPGPSTLRRLTRTEYDQTVRDLLGLSVDVSEKVGIPEESTGAAYDTLANGLLLPPALMDKVFAAADYALERFQATPKAFKTAFGPDSDPAKAIAFLAARAYRRPVSADEVERLLALYRRGASKGLAPEAALRLPLKAVLVSPNFLYRIEADRPAAAGRPGVLVSPHELASRLSYFLTSTMPDADLRAAADSGALAEPAGLEAQARRLLASPRAGALVTGFIAQWLQLSKLASARPSTEYFPTFNGRLKDAMRQEVERFADGLRTGDRSVLEFLDADYTYANQDLAKHYGLGGVQGPQLRRVDLKPEHHRGGLLGMGAVLAINAHTYRTSPTLRGKWILEVLLGTPPPPPPPDAGTIKDEEKKKKEPKTFREVLQQHAAQPACASCHRRIDPLGFALENFDAVGRWRDTQGGLPLDTVGVLPGGEQFQGFAGLKTFLAGQKERFARNFIEQMLCYALGRELQPSDECAVREIQARAAKEGWRFSSIVTGVVRSLPFTHRRGAEKRN